MPQAVAGLFGKLPAHGDFVRRGWPDPTVGAVDAWLTAAMLAARAARDDAGFAAWMRGAPMWEGFVPAGSLGPLALRVVLAASVDRTGRLFPLVAGIAGDEAVVWAGGRLAADYEAAVYDAVAGSLDADAMLVRLEQARGGGEEDDGSAPAGVSLWWPASVTSEEPPAPVRADLVDAALLERLMGTGQP